MDGAADGRSGPNRWWIPAGLVLTLVLAAAVRLWGIDFGLPHPLARPDEMRIATASAAMLEGDFRPRSFQYPALFVGLNAAVRWVGQHTTHADPAGRARLRTIPAAYRVSRALSAAAGVLTVLVVFVLGRAAFDLRTGSLAALLLALTHLHVRDSHFGVTDATLTLFMTLSLLPALAVLRTRSWSATLAGAACAGMAVATKYTGAFVLLPLALAHLLAFGLARQPRALLARLAAGALVAALVFVLFNPYVLLDPARFVRHLAFEFQDKLASGAPSFARRGWVQHASLSLGYGLGLPLLLASLGGAGLLLARRARAHQVLLSCLVYYLLVGGGTKVFVRYMLPLLPVLVVFAAVGLREAARRLAPRRAELAAAGLALLVLLPSAARVVCSDRLLAAEDTRLQATRYLAGLLGPDRRALLVGRFALPVANLLPPGRYEVLSGGQLDELLADGADANEVLGGRFDYVLYGDYFFGAYSAARPETLKALRASLVHHRSFSPLQEGRRREDLEPVFNWQDKLYLPYAGFEGFERAGPFVHLLEVEA